VKHVGKQASGRSNALAGSCVRHTRSSWSVTFCPPFGQTLALVAPPSEGVTLTQSLITRITHPHSSASLTQTPQT
jgi:hypothetical protein